MIESIKGCDLSLLSRSPAMQSLRIYMRVVYIASKVSESFIKTDSSPSLSVHTAILAFSISVVSVRVLILYCIAVTNDCFLSQNVERSGHRCWENTLIYKQQSDGFSQWLCSAHINPEVNGHCWRKRCIWLTVTAHEERAEGYIVSMYMYWNLYRLGTIINKIKNNMIMARLKLTHLSRQRQTLDYEKTDHGES